MVSFELLATSEHLRVQQQLFASYLQPVFTCASPIFDTTREILLSVQRTTVIKNVLKLMLPNDLTHQSDCQTFRCEALNTCAVGKTAHDFAKHG